MTTYDIQIQTSIAKNENAAAWGDYDEAMRQVEKAARIKAALAKLQNAKTEAEVQQALKEIAEAK